MFRKPSCGTPPGHAGSGGAARKQSLRKSGPAIAVSLTLVAASLLFAATSSTQRTFAASPSLTVTASFATCCHGDIEFIAQLQNASAPYDQIRVQGLAPDNTVVYDKTFPVSSIPSVAQDGFLVDRKYVDGSYTVIATYQGQSVSQVLQPYSTFEPQPPTFVAMSASSSSITGRVQGGIEGEQVAASIYSPSGALVKTLTATTSVLNIFEISISASDQAAFSESGTYRVVLTHVPTGITGETTFSYTSPNPQAPPPASNQTTPAAASNESSTTTPPAQQTSSGSSGQQAPTSPTGGTSIASVQTGSNFTATGEISSMVPPRPNVAASGNPANESNVPYLLAGSWSMKAVNGNVSFFSANFTMVRADGTDRHSHQLLNFRPNNSSAPVELNRTGTTTVAGMLDIHLNGSKEWSNVSATIGISRLNTVKILLNSTNPAMANHFRDQPIYGVTNSLVLDGKLLLAQKAALKQTTKTSNAV